MKTIQESPYYAINKIAEKISNAILHKQHNFEVIPLNKEKWLKLPKSNSYRPSIAAVDGGSRIQSVRGLQIYYAQAAGRTMALPNEENQPWVVEQRGGVVLHGRLALNLVKISREILELKIATKLISANQPEYILLDGTLQGIFVIDRTMTSLLTLNDDDAKSEDVFTKYMQIDKNLYHRHIIEYGATLNLFLEIAEKNNTCVVGLAKDSYTQEFITEEIQNAGLSDSSYFTLLSKGNPGRSKGTKTPVNLAKQIPKSVSQYWSKYGITLPKQYNVHSFFATLVKNGQPIRIDFHTPNGNSDPSNILKDLIPFSDGRDWFIPPRLAHERAVVKNDLFTAFLKQIYRRVEAKSPEFAKTILGNTRRERTQ